MSRHAIRRHAFAAAITGGVAAVAVALVLAPTARTGVTGALTADPATLRDALLALGPLAPMLAIGANVGQAVLAPLPGAAIVYLNGAVFGPWTGALLNLVGGVLGALACFALARRCLRSRLTAWLAGRPRWSGLRALVESGSATTQRRDGVAILLLRLVPGTPFDLVSYAAGASRVGWWPFVWGTAVGSAPHAIAYAVLGAKLHVPVWAGVAAASVLGAGFTASRRFAPAVLQAARAARGRQLEVARI